MKYLTLITVLALLASTSCKKLDVELPPMGSPVFGIEAVINGESKKWMAGEEGYYLFTGFDQDSAGLLRFWCRLQPETCDTQVCGEKLAFYFNDLALSPSGQTDVEAALYLGSHPYQSLAMWDTIWIFDTITTYLLNLDARSSLADPSLSANFLWFVPNIGTIVGDTVSIVLPDVPQQLPVTLTVQNALDSCYSSQTQTVFLVSGNQTMPCNVFVDTLTNPVSATPLALVALAQGKAPIAYAWSTGSSDSLLFLGNLPAGFPFEVSISDSQGCTSSASGLTPNQSGTFCSARFSWSVVEQTEVSTNFTVVHRPFEPGGVKLEYTDESGEVWSSELGPQQANNASFQILSVESYDENENGQKTVKISVKFQATLWNQSGQSIQVTDGKGVIAVAYP